MITVRLPLRVRNLTNEREHWAVRGARTKKEHKAVQLALASQAKHVRFPCVVRMTRVIGYRGRELDDDGNVAAFKGVRDAICKCLGIDDGPKSPARFQYAQVRGEAWGIIIEIERVN